MRPDRSPTTSSRRSFRSPTMNRPDTASYAKADGVKTRRRKAQRPGSSRRGLCRRLGRRWLRRWRFDLRRVGFGRSGLRRRRRLRQRLVVLVGAAAVVGGHLRRRRRGRGRRRCRGFARCISRRIPLVLASNSAQPGSARTRLKSSFVAASVDDAHRREPLQHHERVARPSAQALRSRQHRHQRRIVLRPRLQRPPRQVVKRVVVLARRGVERQLAALLPLADSPVRAPRGPPMRPWTVPASERSGIRRFHQGY